MRVRAVLASSLVTCALLLAPALAAADEDAYGELQRAKDLFEYGEFEESRAIVEALLSRNVLATDDQLIDANRIAALGWLYGDDPLRLEMAERHFLQLLSIEPEYRLDPFFTPPAAVEFFEAVKAEHEAQLAPIREQRRRAREARRAEEEARRRFLETQVRAREDHANATAADRGNLALVFLPLGAGQFQNGHDSAGIAIASVQVVAGLTSVISYFAIEDMRDDGGFSRGEMGAARTLDVVKWASGALFWAAWAYGVTDAWIHFESAAPAPAAQPAAGPMADRGGDAPLRLAPSAGALPGGGMVGLGLEF